jgi:hypothetical protein
MRNLPVTLAVTLVSMTSLAPAAMLGDVQSWQQDGNTVTFACGKPLVPAYDETTGILRVSFPDTGGEQLLLVQL